MLDMFQVYNSESFLDIKKKHFPRQTVGEEETRHDVRNAQCLHSSVLTARTSFTNTHCDAWWFIMG